MVLLESAIAKIHSLDKDAMDKVQKHLDNLTKPRNSLGRLEELAKHIAGITANDKPKLKHKVIFTLAGDHGVVDEGVSAYPREVTCQMVYNFLRGGAAINVLARQAGARVIVADMGIAGKLEMEHIKADNKHTQFHDCRIESGTDNFAKGPAMTPSNAIRSIRAGIKLVEKECQLGLDIAGTGDMGIGNTTPSSAITAVMTGKTVENVTGYGTGINDEGLHRKIRVIKHAIAINKPNHHDPIDVLAKLGGYEIGGLAGVIIGCAMKRVPVIIDGFISGAAALIAVKLAPRTKDFIIPSHCSAEKGHQHALAQMGMKPLLDLDMRLGEGTGAALAMMLCESSLRILEEMATFSQANVSEKLG
ncbi:MAG: nicotinate-nucleotide--dimethylbenzimidazole phosphoribosyltransferase [Candidatus Brocadiia bacterium]